MVDVPGEYSPLGSKRGEGRELEDRSAALGRRVIRDGGRDLDLGLDIVSEVGRPS